MHVLFDTNVLRRDLHFEGAAFRALRDYAGKSRAYLLLPALVREEVRELHRREYEKQRGQLVRLQTDLSRYAMQALALENLVPRPEVVAKAYDELLRTVFPIAKGSEIEYGHVPVTELVRRAIGRIAPMKADGQEFRDALIWLSVCEHARQHPREEVWFISENVKQFADGEKPDILHPDLASELRTCGLDVRFASSLATFLKQHAEHIAFLTEEWLEENLPFERIQEQAREHLQEWSGPAVKYMRRALDVAIDSVQVRDLDLRLLDYFVWKEAEGIRVLATLAGECTLASEYRRFDEWGEEPPYRVPVTRTPEAIVELLCSVSEAGILDWHIDSVDLQ